MAMGTYTPHRLVALFDQRWSSLGDWRNRWEEMTFYIMPQMRSFTSEYSPGNRRSEQLIYDSTALEANERLATRLHEALTNPSIKWFRLKFKNQKLNTNDAAREWLDSTETLMRQAISASNFDMTMGQFYLDLGCLGTANLSCEEKKPEYGGEADGVFHGLTFRAMHMEGCVFHENSDGIIDEIFYRFDLTAEACMQKWEERAPQRAKDHVKEGKNDHKIKILVCRFKRTLKTRPTGPLLGTERPWAEVWINYSDKEVIDDNGTYEQAAFTGRWRRKSVDIMGYGPGERALPTIRTINEAERLELAAWAKVIDPPLKTTQNNVIGDVDIRAKGITVVRSMDELEEWNLKPDINHHMIQLEDKRYQIRDIFKYHQLELPPREQVGEMTAYEISKRIEQIYRALGGTVAQIQADVLNGLIQRVFGIMYRKNALPALPEEIESANLTVEYVGPMALAARATEIEAIDRFIGDALALYERIQDPSVLDIVDLDKAQVYKAELMGVPAIVLRDEAEIKDARDARQAIQAQQAEEESAIKRSEAVKNLGAGIGQDAAAAGLAEMANGEVAA